MDSLTIQNYRCFRERQTARLAPLTLLVGENSTGKSSFLAMIRIMSQLAAGNNAPDFKEPPYDLGSFDEIAFADDESQSGATSFIGGFESDTSRNKQLKLLETVERFRFEAEFQKRGPAPALTRRSMAMGSVSMDEELLTGNRYRAHVRTPRGQWRLEEDAASQRVGEPPSLPRLPGIAFSRGLRAGRGEETPFTPTGDSPSIEQEDLMMIDNLGRQAYRHSRGRLPFASAPVRSTPHRTYDPAPPNPDPDGNYIPMYLADLSHQKESDWKRLKSLLEKFGKDADLFDEIVIRQFDRGGIDPFQIQIRKGGRSIQAPPRNLIDVGYGVSQVLPVITELHRKDSARQYLLQQPEVHLHPRAQAALGGLFCKVAARGQQLVVETHSDHLVDRVRMEVRDRKTALRPSDVRILYFERQELDVKIYELWWDENGNLENAPPSYRRFFMHEVERSIWPPE